MNNTVKAASVIAAGFIGAVALYMYFSPYNQCVRAKRAELIHTWGWEEAAADRDAKFRCAQNSN